MKTVKSILQGLFVLALFAVLILTLTFAVGKAVISLHGSMHNQNSTIKEAK
jgi:hypothetical protein